MWISIWNSLFAKKSWGRTSGRGGRRLRRRRRREIEEEEEEEEKEEEKEEGVLLTSNLRFVFRPVFLLTISSISSAIIS